jgi:bis(5'-nucleosidyl)-tetraphosphatase
MKREWHHSAGVIVFREDSPRSYLLMRSALTRRPVWEFPKGALEAGETELQAAERELQEETGLAPSNYTLVDGFHEEERYYFTRGAGEDLCLIRKRVNYFLAEWTSGDVRISREASRYEWVPAEEALRMLRFPEKRRVLTRAEEWLANQRAASVDAGQRVESSDGDDDSEASLRIPPGSGDPAPSPDHSGSTTRNSLP